MISQQTKTELKAIDDRLEFSPERHELQLAVILSAVAGAAHNQAHLDALQVLVVDFATACLQDIQERKGR
jgi:hypothetical protein